MKSKMFAMLCLLLAQSITFAQNLTTDAKTESVMHENVKWQIQFFCQKFIEKSSALGSQIQCEQEMFKHATDRFNWYYKKGFHDGIKECGTK